MKEIYRSTVHVDARKGGRSGIYRHSFRPGARIYGKRDGSILIRRDDGKRLWDYYDEGNETMTAYLTNPRGVKRDRRTGRFVRRKKRRTTRRKTRRRNPSTLAVSSNEPRRARRRSTVKKKSKTPRQTYRRNPPIGNAAIKALQMGATIAAGVVAADVAVSYAQKLAPQLAGPLTARLGKAAFGLFVLSAGSKILGASTARSIAIGAFAGVMIDVAREQLYPSLGIAAYVPDPSVSAYLPDGTRFGAGATMPAVEASPAYAM